MSSKRHQRRICERKQRHETQAQALAHAAWLRKKTGNHTYMAYRCAWGHWHAGRRSHPAFVKRTGAA